MLTLRADRSMLLLRYMAIVILGGSFGALLPYRRARTLPGTFFPVSDLPTIDTVQRRALQVGARLLWQNGRAKPLPLYLKADIGTAVLRAHFRRLIRVTIENDETLLFRFYGPRILTRFLLSCDAGRIISQDGLFESETRQ